MPRLNPFAWGRTKLTKLWDASIEGHVISLAWQPPSAGAERGALIAAASADGPIALFDAKTGQSRFQLPGHGFGTSCVAWSPDGMRLASTGQDGKIRLWDPATGQLACEMPAGAAWGERVAWAPVPIPADSPGAWALASAAGKKLRLWKVDGTLIAEFPEHPSTIADIQWKPRQAILASTAYGKVFLWECQALPPAEGAAIEPKREFTWQGSMLALAWSPDARYLAVGAQDCTVHFWVLATGEDLQMSGYPRKVRELSWDPTSRYLATGGAELSCVWDFSGEGPAGTEPTQLEAHKDFINYLAFQHQGTLLASGGDDGQVILWKPSTQRGAISLAKHSAAVTQLAWSADDERLVAGTAAGGVVVYAI